MEINYYKVIVYYMKSHMLHEHYFEGRYVAISLKMHIISPRANTKKINKMRSIAKKPIVDIKWSIKKYTQPNRRQKNKKE